MTQVSTYPKVTMFSVTPTAAGSPGGLGVIVHAAANVRAAVLAKDYSVAVVPEIPATHTANLLRREIEELKTSRNIPQIQALRCLSERGEGYAAVLAVEPDAVSGMLTLCLLQEAVPDGLVVPAVFSSRKLALSHAAEFVDVLVPNADWSVVSISGV